MKKRDILIALILFVVALVFYMVKIDLKSIWYDETLSLIISGKSLGKIFYILRHSSPHPPLYFLFLKPFIYFDNIFLWRGVSAFFMSLGVPAVYLLVRRYINEISAILMAFLYILSPLALYYSQEIRMYALVAGFFSWFLYLHFIYFENNNRYILAFLSVVGLFFSFSHFFSLLILPAFIVTVFYMYLISKEKKYLFVTISDSVNFLLITLWYFGAKDAMRAADIGGRVYHISLMYYVKVFSKFWNLPGRLAMILLILITLYLIFLFYKKRFKDIGIVLIFFTLFFPWFLLKIKPPKHWLNPRYFIAFLPLFLLSFSIIVNETLQLFPKYRKIFFVGFFIIWTFLVFNSIKYDKSYFQRDKHAWLEVIEYFKDAGVKDGDFYFFQPPYIQPAFVFNVPFSLKDKLIIFKKVNRILPLKQIEFSNKQVFVSVAPLLNRLQDKIRNNKGRIFIISNTKQKVGKLIKSFNPIEGRLFIYEL